MTRKATLLDEVQEQLEGVVETVSVDPRLAVLAAIRDRLPAGPEEAEAQPHTEVPSRHRARKAGDGAETQAQPEAPASLEEALRRLREAAEAERSRVQALEAEARELEGRLQDLKEARSKALRAFREAEGLTVWAPEQAKAVLELAQRRLQEVEAEAQAASARLQEVLADPGVHRLRAEAEAKAQAEAREKAAREAATRAKELARGGDILGSLKALRGHEGTEVEAVRALVADEARHRAREALGRARLHLRSGQPQEAMSLLEEAVPVPGMLGPEDRRAIHGAYLAAARAVAPEGAVFAWVGQGGLLLALPAGKGIRVLRGLGIPWRAGAQLHPRTLRVRPLREQPAAPAAEADTPGEAS